MKCNRQDKRYDIMTRVLCKLWWWEIIFSTFILKGESKNLTALNELFYVLPWSSTFFFFLFSFFILQTKSENELNDYIFYVVWRTKNKTTVINLILVKDIWQIILSCFVFFFCFFFKENKNDSNSNEIKRQTDGKLYYF